MNFNIVNFLKEKNKSYINDNEIQMKKAGENFSRVELFGRLLLVKFFNEIGFLNNPNEEYLISDITKKIGLIPKYNKLFEVLICILQNEGFIKKHNDKITTTAKIKSKEIIDKINNLDNFKKDMIELYNDMSPHFNLLEVSINNYKELLNGKKTGDEVLFPMFSTELVKNIFTNNILADYFNKSSAMLISGFVEYSSKNNKEKLKILEVGSGTGGTSLFVLKELLKYSDDIEYYFTDISNIFVKKAKKLFGNNYPFAVFKKFDIESSSADQGFNENQFDCIFASNVVHSTKNINNSLNNIYKLLKNNGIFILNEVTSSQDFVNLTFGLMDGWWKFNDPEIRIGNSPLLNKENWEKVLKENNFKNIEIITSTHQDKKDSFSQSLILCSK